MGKSDDSSSFQKLWEGKGKIESNVSCQCLSESYLKTVSPHNHNNINLLKLGIHHSSKYEYLLCLSLDLNLTVIIRHIKILSQPDSVRVNLSIHISDICILLFRRMAQSWMGKKSSQTQILRRVHVSRNVLNSDCPVQPGPGRKWTSRVKLDAHQL